MGRGSLYVPFAAFGPSWTTEQFVFDNHTCLSAQEEMGAYYDSSYIGNDALQYELPPVAKVCFL
jgi:hypothetical protein